MCPGSGSLGSSLSQYRLLGVAARSSSSRPAPPFFLQFEVPSMSAFAELGVPAALINRLAAHAITAPFPIQAACLRDALAGRDLCGCAPTGSGKTLAFGLALVARSVKA